jgi:hypothetical protein
MEAKELMVGNYIEREKYLVNTYDKEKFNQIEVGHNDICACTIAPKKFKPISLTEEWLLKFGFRNSNIRGGWYVILNNDLILVIDMDTNKAYLRDNENTLLRIVNHIHTLQNLHFSLTGKELTIKK